MPIVKRIQLCWLCKHWEIEMLHGQFVPECRVSNPNPAFRAKAERKPCLAFHCWVPRLAPKPLIAALRARSPNAAFLFKPRVPRKPGNPQIARVSAFSQPIHPFRLFIYSTYALSPWYFICSTYVTHSPSCWSVNLFNILLFIPEAFKVHSSY